MKTRFHGNRLIVFVCWVGLCHLVSFTSAASSKTLPIIKIPTRKEFVSRFYTETKSIELIECKLILPPVAALERKLLSMILRVFLDAAPQIIDILLGHWEAYMEMSRFLLDGFEKFGNLSCTTVIWDRELSTVLDYTKFCLIEDQDCSNRYMAMFEGGNMTDDLMTTLRAGYREQCGGYVVLLSSSNAVTDLLHYGDDLRIINTRARFLIWYGDRDKGFESDEIWKKLPNVILFHTTLRKRSSRNRRLSFTIMTFKWPVVVNVQDSTRIIDFWRSGMLAKNEDTWYRDKTRDLRNVTLRILVVEHPPSVIKYSSPDGYVEYAGTEIEVIKELSMIMNFEFELVDADPVTKWGGEIVDNSTRHFYGAFARIIYGETDMGIGSFLILKHYLDYLDMSIPLDVACTSFLTPNPLPRPRYLALILPFQIELWILVLSICFIFAPIGLYALARLPLHSAEYPLFSSQVNQTVFTSLSIMSQVALHIWPKFWSIRMFIGWYWLFCLLITLAYRGAMVSFLTIPLYEKPIDTVYDLAASGLRIGGWGKELYTLFTQQGTSDEDTTKSYLANKYELIDDYDHGISMVADGKFGLYENIRYLKFIRMTRNLTKMGSPSMRVMKQCIVPVHIGIAYQKNSPISPTINRHIRRFQESGLLKRWSQRLIAKTKQYYKEQLAIREEDMLSPGDNPDKEDGIDEEEADETKENNKQRKQRVLSIKDLQGAIYLIFFGTFLSVGAFLGELFLAHSRHAAININKELKKIVDKTKLGKDNSTEMSISSKTFDLEFAMLAKIGFTSPLKHLPKLKRLERRKSFLKKEFPFLYLE